MNIYVNDKKIEHFNFSGGECHVKVDPANISNQTRVLAKLHHSDAIMQLLMVVDAVRQVCPETQIDLTIPYFPYARQDRVCNPGEAFGVKVMADLINQLNCNTVTVFDPHSQVTVNALNNCKVVSLADIVLNSPLASQIKNKNITLVSPDKGAKEKVSEVAQRVGQEFICASKVREPSTGQIIGTDVQEDVAGKTCLILDDICDGGKTFTELAKLLSSKGADSISLYVTHGIFSKGLSVLKEHFSHVYCYQTTLKPDQIDPDFLTVLET